jgi:M6 family metalloprotease-like protein
MLRRRLSAGAVPAVFFFTLTILTVQAAAHPVSGELWRLRQPDGTLVDVRIWGDEYYQFVESLDGYTLVRDPSSGAICYARLSPNGSRLESTRVRVGSVDPSTLRLVPGLRIHAEAAQAEAASARIDRERRVGMGLASRGLPVDMPRAATTTGEVRGLVIIVDFEDQQATIPREDIDGLFNQIGYTGYDNNGSVRDYFRDVSNGLLDFTNFVAPVYYRAQKPFTYYDDCNLDYHARVPELFAEALDHLDAAGLDFSQFDNDGDGYIDALSMFYAGTTHCGWAQGLWSGAGYFWDWSWSADGVETERYQVVAMGPTLGIGAFCHEAGHMVMGWPDLYDYGGDSYGIGSYCLMCSFASRNNPVEPCAYLKALAGWSDVRVLNAGSPQEALEVPSEGSVVYKFPHPSLDNEYYLIENRQRTGRDELIPDDGLAIWHIDTEGWNSYNEMTPQRHYEVTLVQADGRWDMERRQNRGDETDLYPSAGKDACTECTVPSTKWWSGAQSGLAVGSISESDPVMTFNFSVGNSPPVAVCKTIDILADEDGCAVVTRADIDGGSYDPNGASDIDELCIMELDGDYVPCQEEVEVCGLGAHSVKLMLLDQCSRSTRCTAEVNLVEDVTAPSISIAVEPDVLWPPNHKLEDITASVSVVDDFDDAPTFVLTSVTCDEERARGVAGKPDIDAAAFGTPDTTLRLRAERDGGGNGRTYTLLYTATDASGNEATATATVTVPHDMSDIVTDDPLGKSGKSGIDGPAMSPGDSDGLSGIMAVYPNPFNPVTTVEYGVGKAGHVSIAIYDVRGTRVRTLVDGHATSGTHRVQWLGTDTRGRAVPAGIYFVRIVLGGFAQARRIVLLK